MFCFRLKPVEKCALPGNQVKNLSWFYLTDSWYSIHLGSVRLFESSSQWMEKYPGNSFLDYYYIRWLEDFFDILPLVCANVPLDLYRLIDSEEKRISISKRLDDYYEKYDINDGEVPEEIENNYFTALKLICHGVLDTGFLRFTSLCRYCRMNDNIIIHYDFRDHDEDGIPVWAAGSGQYVIGYERFLVEIQDMLDRFFTAMEQQIKDASQMVRNYSGQYGMSGNKVQANPDEILKLLEKEQAERKDYFYKLLSSIKKSKEPIPINWDEVRNSFSAIGLLDSNIKLTCCAISN